MGIYKFLIVLKFANFLFIIWIIGFLVLLSLSFRLSAQNVLRYNTEKEDQFMLELFPDSLQRAHYIEELLRSFQMKGYPSAFVEKKTFHGDSLTIRVQAGELYEWVFLKKGSLGDGFAQKLGFEQQEFQNRPFNIQKLQLLFEKVLEESQNSGHPFAAIGLDSIVQQGNGIGAAINLQLGPFITFDTVQTTGNSKTSRLFLNRFLKIFPGTAFSQKKIDQSIKNLKNLPFLQLVNDPQLTFQNQSAILFLPINDRPINTLDGIIGILPNEVERNKLLVTGEFDLSLYNVSGKGRNYKLNWQRMSQYSQSLGISAEEPMLLGSSLDLKVSYHLLKQDTTFINRDFRVDFGYRTGPSTYLGFFSRRQSGDLLAVSQFAQVVELPDMADFRFNNYGVNFQWENLDDSFWPRRGLLTELELGIGNKKLVQNTGLPTTLYQDMDMNSPQYYLTLTLEKHVYLRPNIGILGKMASGEMGNAQLLLNDLFRLGGLKSIRGFNENFFFANRFIYGSFEPRYYFDDQSYFLLFSDFGGLQNKVDQEELEYPFSFGGGFSLESGAGVFNFVYAMGRSNTQDLGFHFSKIHFGFTGRF